MKIATEGDISILVDESGNVFITGRFTLPISKDNARDIFLNGISDDPNQGLFPLEAGSKSICLSVMPDDVAKIYLNSNQVAAIQGLM